MVPLIVALMLPLAKKPAFDVDACTQDLHLVSLRFSPVEKAWQAPSHPESHSEMRRRYRSIARDICEAVKAQPAIEGFTKAGTARLTLAQAIGESNLAKDADRGPCWRKAPYQARCDGGLAVGVLQVQLPQKHRDRGFADRPWLVSVALRGLRGSFGACRHLPVAERLALYASGSCKSAAGRRASRRRWKLIQRVLVWQPPEEGDS